MKSIFTLLIMIACFKAGAQIDTVSLDKNIYASEDSMMALFKQRDWKSYVNYMNPVIIKMTGGKEGFEKLLKEQTKFLDAADTIFTRLGNILQLVRTKNQFQCISESFIQMHMSGMTVSGSSYDIGVSDDGNSWTFFRITERMTAAQIKQILTGLDPRLKLPRSQIQRVTLQEFMKTYKIEYLQ